MAKPQKKARRADIRSLQDDVAAIGAEVAAFGNTLGETTSTETRAAMNAIPERLEKLREDAYEVRDAGMEDVRRRIEDNPIASVLIAFCLGGIFSWMLRR